MIHFTKNGKCQVNLVKLYYYPKVSENNNKVFRTLVLFANDCKS